MNDEQWVRFKDSLTEYAKVNSGLTVTDIFMLKEAFMSCELERNSNNEDCVMTETALTTDSK